MALNPLKKIQGITIPTKQKDINVVLEDIDTILKETDTKLTKDEEWWYNREKKKLKLENDEKKIANLQLKYNSPTIYKIKQKLTKTYDKYLANGQWFKSSLKAFKTMGEKSGHWLLNILKFLLLMAFFDPKGKFLRSILKFILGMVKWFVDIIVQYLPEVISTIIYLITDVIPPILKEVFSAISKIIYDGLTKWIDKLPPDSFLRKVLEFIRAGFGEDGIITKFFSNLAGLFPVIIIILGIFVVLGKLAPVFSILVTIFEAMQSIAEFLSISVGWVIVAVVAVIAIIILLVKHWDKIKEVLITTAKFIANIFVYIGKKIWEGIIYIKDKIIEFAKYLWGKVTVLWDKFEKLGKGVKTITFIVLALLSPLGIFIATLYGLVKVFKMFKKYGISGTFKIMGEGIKNIAKSAKDWASSKIDSAWQTVKETKVGKAVGAAIDWAGEMARGIFDGISRLWNSFKETAFGKWISKVLDSIKQSFNEFIVSPFGGGDKNETAFVAYQKAFNSMSEDAAEEMWKELQKNDKKGIYDWLAEVRKVTGDSSIKDVTEAIQKLIESRKNVETVRIDKSGRFETKVKVIK